MDPPLTRAAVQNAMAESRQQVRAQPVKNGPMNQRIPLGNGTAAPHQSSRSTLIAYIALALTWGSSFLLMKVALNEFTPGQVALGRILVGAVTLTALMLATRRTWPRERWLWGHMAVVAVFLCVLPFLLFAWAETFLPSGIGAILNSTTPIWTAIAMTIIVRGTRLTWGQAAGIVLGAGGVLMIMGVWQVVTAPAFLSSLPAQAACLGATASYGLAFAWMARYVNGRHAYDPISIASVQLANAAEISLVLAPFIAATPVVFRPVPTLALLALGGLGTGAAYVWNTRVIITWGSLTASTVTYLIPLVGIVLGIVILGERLRWHEPLGALVVILSVMLVQKRRPSTTWLRSLVPRPLSRGEGVPSDTNS
jgi:drug/metabolite transporter (DMT)-like permease